YMDKLKEQAGSDERVIFTGFVDGALREELYSNACLFVLPSDLEGMPLCLLEAMSYGNCVITSDIEECTNVIHDNGISFRKSDMDDLAQKLTYALSHPNTVRMFKWLAAEYVCTRFPWERIVEETLALYEKNNGIQKSAAAFAAGAFLFSANFSASGGHARRAARPRSPARSAPAKTPRSGAAAF
ncbi:MAG: glycosyltransferase family 4 protein, partial [Faecalibacterium prausnitzii]